MSNIYITGIGIISAIGNNVAETMNSIRSGKSGLTKLENIKSRQGDKIMVGEVKKTDDE